MSRSLAFLVILALLAWGLVFEAVWLIRAAISAVEAVWEAL